MYLTLETSCVQLDWGLSDSQIWKVTKPRCGLTGDFDGGVMERKLVMMTVFVTGFPADDASLRIVHTSGDLDIHEW